jgi:hypothetical protein
MKKNKSQKLEEKINEVFKERDIINMELGGASKDEQCIWTVERINLTTGITITTLILYYFNWWKEKKVWIEKSIWELEGPALLNCPIKLFLIPVDPDYEFPEWRYEVKRFHEKIGPEVQNDQILHRLINDLKQRN